VRSRRLLAELLFALTCLAPASLAQQPPPAEAQPASRGKVVVVLDLLPDATANARLRAAVYETARAEGFEPDPRADVVTAANTAGVMEAGAVKTDEASLQTLRAALGASVLIRVAADPAGTARVVVAAERGAQSRSVAAAEAPITGAVRELLSEVAPKPAPPAAPPPTPPAAQPEGTWIGASQRGRRGAQAEDEEPVGPEAIRRRWDLRGGVRASYEVRGAVTGIAFMKHRFSDRNPVTGETESGDATAYAIGGGVGVRFSMFYLPISVPEQGSTSWAAFRLGTGVDLNALYYRPPVGYLYKRAGAAVSSRDTEYDDKALFYGLIPLQLGFHVAFGKYRSDTIWRGTGIGLAYSPSVLYELEIGKTVGDWDFNWGGVEGSIDVISIEADKDGTNDAQVRLAVLLLPRVRSSLPWLVSAGVGIVWY
jgi:hypothetical protein